MGRDEPRGRRLVAQLERGDAALGGGIESRRVLRAQRVRVRLSERDEQCRRLRSRAVGGSFRRTLHRALAQLLRHLAGDRLQHPPAASVEAGGGDAPEPAPLDLAEPRRHRLARDQLGEAPQDVRDVVRDPVLDGAHHSRVSQSKRRCGIPRTTSTSCAS